MGEQAAHFCYTTPRAQQNFRYTSQIITMTTNAPNFSVKIASGKFARLQAKADAKKTLHLYTIGLPPMWTNQPGDKKNRASVVAASLRCARN